MKKTFLLAVLFCSNSIIAQTYNGSIGVINDVAINDFPLVVSGLNPSTIDTIGFGLETICINLTHTYDSDLEISIIAPDGTSKILATGLGGGGQDYTNTCFNNSALINITSSSPPFTGTFISQGYMGMVNNGQNGNGTWNLRVRDMAAQDVGNLLAWSITFGNAPATFPNLLFSSSNMPIVIINTNNQNINQTGKITADMGIIYNGINVRNYMTDPFNNYNGKIGIEIRGNFSSGLPQKPYEFETRDINGFSIDSSLLGMPAENDWDLIAMYNDKSFMRNSLSYNTFDEIGHWGPRSKLCEVVLNGDYQGVYALCETIKRDANRVDIAKLNQTDITWPEVSGGYILKTDYWNNSNSWLLGFSPIDHPGFDIHMVYFYPQPQLLVPQQKTYIQTFSTIMKQHCMVQTLRIQLMVIKIH